MNLYCIMFLIALVCELPRESNAGENMMSYIYDRSGNLIFDSYEIGIEKPSIVSTVRYMLVASNDPIALCIPVNGSRPFMFQWTSDGVVIPGATNECFEIANGNSTNLGNYQVVVSNSAGAVTSAVIVVDFDTDRDGLPDAWERNYFNSLQQSSVTDYDHDGVSDWDELFDGTNPTNSASVLPRLSVEAYHATVTVVPYRTKYSPGDTVTLTAVPHRGWVFRGWEGDTNSSQNPLVITLYHSLSLRGVCDMTLGEALDALDFQWSSGDAPGWIGQNEATHDYEDAAESGPLADFQHSWVETTVTNTYPIAIDWWWKVIGPQGGSKFDARIFFLLNGMEAASTTFDTWQSSSTCAEPGVNVLRWDFFGGIGSQNKAYLDQVSIRRVPGIYAVPTSVAEGDEGYTDARIEVGLDMACSAEVAVSFNTSDGNAVSSSDYVSTNETLIFPPGNTKQWVTVKVRGDVTLEPNEVFYLWLNTTSTAAFLLSSEIPVTIINDDGVPGKVDHFAWAPVGSLQIAGVPFAAQITALDGVNQTVSNFQGSVALRAGGKAVTLGTGTGTSSFPIGGYYRDARTQVIYPASEVGPAGRITALALDVSTVPDHLKNRWSIRLKHTPLSGYSSYTWDSDGWMMVYQTNLTVTASGWAVFKLTTPFDYNGIDNLMIDFSFYNSTLRYVDGLCRSTLRPGTRTLFYVSSGTSGDPLTWTGRTPAPYTSSSTPNLRIFYGPTSPVAMQPTNVSGFVAGVWRGDVMIQDSAMQIVLSATDSLGRQGLSNPFDVAMANDLAVYASATPVQATAASNLTYVLTVVNPGPSISTQVRLTNALPASVNFVSSASSQGTCYVVDRQLVCDLGTVNPGTPAIVSIVCVPTLAGVTLTNQVTILRNETDPNTNNNSAVLINSVGAPFLAITPAAVMEGNAGMTTVDFQLRLHAPTVSTVAVAYATADGTALAGNDYAATNGIVTFMPGTTNRSVGVTVWGDITVEPDEVFYLRLSNVTNALLATNQAVSTIVNDDGLPGQIHHLVWAPISSPQGIGEPFAVAITAQDVASNLVNGFSGTVSLGTLAGTSGEVSVGAGTSSANYPLGSGHHDERTQVIYLLSEVGGAGRITALALDVTTLPSQMLNKWTIRMKHTSLANYSGGAAWEGNGWTLVYQANQIMSSMGWVGFVFTTPFDYNGVDNLLVDFSFNNSSYTSDGMCRYSTMTPSRTISYRTDSGYGDPLNWLGSTSPTPTVVSAVPNIRLTKVAAGDAVTISPTNTGNFVNGVWSGSLTVLGAGRNIVLRAVNGEGHSGNSNPFEVVPVTRLLPSIPSPGVITLRFLTEPGKSYTVEFKNALDDPTWMILEAVAGDGSEKAISDSFASSPHRYYRLRSQE